MKRMKRVLASILATAMMVTAVPVSEFNVLAAALDIKNQVSDPGTLNQWEEYFGVGNDGKISTEYAGAVWTDKSVFTNENLGNSFSDVTKDSLGANSAITVGKDNFLVAMSALSSTKQIKGYSYTPTDTVFVLDTSGSMQDNEIEAMVKAANEAITKLYETNNYNRVGIAVYNLNAVTLMPIDRYTASTDEKNPYLTYSKVDGTRYISVTRGVKDSSGKNYSNSVAGRSGTYTQGGMQQGVKLFLDTKDTSIEVGNIQAGTKRIPVMVLMTDGDPTSGASNYLDATATNRNIGKDDYATTTDELVFLTQLTAANVHNQMEKHYGRDCLFYTLGLGVSGNHAAQMLQPSTVGNNTARKLDEYWKKYNASETGTEICKYTGEYKGRKLNISIKRLTDLDDGTKLVEDRYYTDKYFPASDSAGLIRAFENIVQEIILQSKYYPTLVTSGKQDLDGYVTIVDELGENMVVKSIKGLVYENTLFTGEALIRAMEDGLYGNRNNWSEYGWELVESIRERLEVAATGDNTDNNNSNAEFGTPIKLSNDVVIDLLQKAWADGQIGHIDGGFNNYISYYVNAKGQYLGFHGKEHTVDSYPKGTKYIGRSYLFQGQISSTSDGNIANGEMMHIVVQVYEDINTGHQTVTWRVPASLVPLVQYEIRVKGNVLNSNTIESLECIEDSPIRVLYEVGLTEEITPLNLAEIMKEEDHVHLSKDETGNPDGGYWFYSNRWGNGHGVTELDPNNHKATVAHFNPSVENERYYFTEDKIIYNENGTRYTGDTKPVDLYENDDTKSGYVHYLEIVSATGNYDDELNATVSSKTFPISKTVLELSQKDEDGNWYIPKGTIYHQIARDRVEKTTNVTETLGYSDYPKIVEPDEHHSKHEVFCFLGNNGRLALYPATGLKLTKTIDHVVPETNTNDFVFEIKLSADVKSTEISVTDANNQDKEYQLLKNGQEVSAGDTIVVTLANNETVYVTGLKAGTTYTITEHEHNSYVLESITDQGSGTIEEYKIHDVVALNVEKGKEGDLIVSKTVTHPYGPDYEIPNDKKFNITVELKNPDNTPYANQILSTSTGNTYTTNEEGKITFTLGHSESVMITELPAGINYVVTESVSSDNGYSWDASQSTNLTGVIIADTNVQANVVNEYRPTKIHGNEVKIPITKSISGRDWKDTDSFQFELYRLDTTNTWVAKETITIAASDAEHKKDFTLSSQEFNSIGTYWFKIEEVSGGTTQNGLTYDPTVYIFGVVVEDTEMSGLVITKVIKVDGTTEYADKQVNATFDNKYDLTGNAKAEIKVEKTVTNTTNVDVDLSKFQFGLYADAECTELVTLTDLDNIIEANATGDASFTLTYSKDVFGTGDDKQETVTFTYYVKEIAKGEGDSDHIPGITYNSTAYPVKVTVTDNGDGTMSASVSYPNQGSVVILDNRYSLTPAKISLTGTKKLTGRDMKEGEFTFLVYQTKSDFAVADGAEPVAQATVDVAAMNENVAEDTFSFGTSEFTKKGRYYLVVKEQYGGTTSNGVSYDNSVYHVIVDVDKDSENPSALKATPSIVKVGGGETSIEFSNKYTINDVVSVNLEAQKVLTGKDLDMNAFTFNLYEAEYNESTNTGSYNGTALQTNVGNAANSGLIQFEKIEYTVPGTHYYAIVENIPEGATNNVYQGVTYDANPVRYVKVTVTDNGDGTLSATTEKLNGNTTFNNSYAVKPNTITLRGTKAYVNEQNALVPIKENLKFALYPAKLEGSKYVIDTSKEAIVDETAASQSGKVNFEIPITYTSKGTHYYVLQEVLGSNPTTVYDIKTYDIMDVVTDNGDGTLAINRQIYHNGAVVSEFNDTDIKYEFLNIYRSQKTQATVFALKNVTNEAGAEISKEGFRFGLYENLDKEPIATALTDKDGNLFINLDYTDEDIPVGQKSKTVTYYLKEMYADKNGDYVADTINGMRYDSTIYEVTITLKYNEDNILTTVTELMNLTTQTNVEAAAFSNIYELKPETDFSITGTKSFSGRNLKDGEFEFALYKATVEENENWVKGEQIGKTVKNTGSSFTFDEVETYSTVATHHYLIEEVRPASATAANNYTVNGITYDTKQIKVTVEVVDNGNGELKASITEINGKDPAAENVSIEFKNTYKPNPISVDIYGEKTLTGGREDGIKINEFAFELYETGSDYVIASGAKAIATVNNSNEANTKEFKFEGGKEAGKVKQLYFTDAETRYFVVKEKIGTDPTITYSTIEHNVRVTVTKDQNTGLLSADVREAHSNAGIVSITNIYNSKEAFVNLDIKKTLTNETGVPIDIKSFEFGLYEDASCENPYMIDGSHVKVSPADDLGHAVITLNYTDKSYSSEEDKVYTYYLKEIVSDTPIAGMDYDQSVYKLDVTLSYNNKKELVATPVLTKIVDKDGSNSNSVVQNVTFDNVYTLTPAEVSIDGSKTLISAADNKDIWNTDAHKDKTFAIELYKTDATQNYEKGVLIGKETVSATNRRFEFTNNKLNSDGIDALKFTQKGTYYFAVREENGATTSPNGIRYDGKEYGVVVTVDAGTGENAGKLVANVKTHLVGHTADTELEFENIYEITGKTSVEFKGQKNLSNRNAKEHEFTFELYEAAVQNNVWSIGATPYRTVTNSGNQSKEFAFGNLQYDAVGTHHYVIKEVDFKDPTIIYDSTEYRVTVDVTDNHNGGLENTVTIIKVVKDNQGNEQVTDVTADGIVFDNKYQSISTKAVINIVKDVMDPDNTGMDKQGFVFGLYKNKECTEPYTVNNVHATAKTNTAGNARIELTFSDQDISSEVKTYYLKEMYADKDHNNSADTIPGMVYSEMLYRIDISVGYEQEGENVTLKAKPVITSVADANKSALPEAVFTNSYDLANAELVLSGKKELSGKDALHSNYMFDIYNAELKSDGTVNENAGVWEKSAKIEQVVNAGKYKEESSDYDRFEFSKLTYDKAGTYYYIIEEEPGTLGGVTYDKTIYQLTVSVTASENEAKLVAAITGMEKVTYDDQNNATVTAIESNFASAIEFHNSYVPSGKFVISGKKELINRAWDNTDTFVFELYATNEKFEILDKNPISRDVLKGTDNEKTFELSAALTGAKRYYFVLKEAVGADEHITYDNNEYHIIVDTMDNGDGTMKIGKYDEETKTFTENEFAIQKVQQKKKLIFLRSIQVLDEDVSAEEIVFTNTYKTVPVSISIDGVKDLTGSVTGREIVDDEFTFELYDAEVRENVWKKGQLIAETSNKGNSFEMKDVVSFEKAGTFYYIVTEKAGTNPIISYDKSEQRIKVIVEEIGKNSSNEAILKATLYYVDSNGNATEITESVKLVDFMKFSNKYNDTQAEILINKVVKSTGDIVHTKEGFKFQLKDVTNGKINKDIVTDKDGNVSIALQYNEFDIGHIYKYELSEINTGEKHMKYDAKVYQIDVIVSVDNETKQLIATIIIDGELVTGEAKVSFENIYSGRTPKEDKEDEPNKPVEVVVVPPQTTVGASTGDGANIGLFISLAAVALLGITGIKFCKRKKH